MSDLDRAEHFILDGIKNRQEVINKYKNSLLASISAYGLRKETIENSLENPAKTTITSLLPWILLILGGASVAAILAIKLFDEEIQMEWVSSGQVIQFVTVMILLSVITALALSGILTENTLGPLLGGIGGYVLAQGVGRAAANSALSRRKRD